MRRSAHAGAVPAGDSCPSCGRFIGPADACPYCGTDSARNPLLRLLRRVAVVLALAGLAALYATASCRERPAVPVGRITPMMNFAYAAVRGAVEREAYVSREGREVDYVSFVLDDGTGRIRVAAYDEAARELAGSGRLPRRGDLLEARGSLAVPAGAMPRLRLAAAGELRLLQSGGAAAGPRARRGAAGGRGR
jgi:ribosomal protein L32